MQRLAGGAKDGRRGVDGVAESAYAWLRLGVALLVSAIGGVGMWSSVVALPAIQAEFGAGRADASLPYALTLLGFGLAGIFMGRLSDRFGVIVPVLLGSTAMAAGFVAAGSATALWQYTLAQGLLVGGGSAATFGPLLADASMWFHRRRGTAVGIIGSGTYVGGAVWSPTVQYFIAAEGWRHTYFGIAAFCVATMLPLALVLRRRPPAFDAAPSGGPASLGGTNRLGISPAALQTLLIISGVSCCVAMSMPQVHLVAYCSDLGYGAARGAQMLALMLGCGIVSRVAFGMISDRIGGLRTLLIGAALQGLSLLLYLPFDGLVSLYLVSALFGLLQGGIVPSYTIIVREYFSPTEAGARVGAVLMATMMGMALGGWMSGAIFDLAGTYKAAFANGILWNLVTLSIAGWLLRRHVRRGRARAALA